MAANAEQSVVIHPHLHRVPPFTARRGEHCECEHQDFGTVPRLRVWRKPVKYLLLGDEYPVYQSALSIRTDKLTANSACLSKLVPLFQQAQSDYIGDPAATNQLMLDVVDTLDTSGFGLSAGLLADGNKKQTELGLIANGSDGTLGSFDTARVQGLIDRLIPVFADQETAPKPGLAPADLVTNDFLDPSISLK